MQHDSNPQNVQPETSVSNAVLTPDQIHPNFFKMKKAICHVNRRRTPTFENLGSLSTYEIQHRNRWAIRQVFELANIPSSAVLGA